MSDDEYYYDGDFDDFHDMLYDADPAPDLADDLAEHAAYSPIWQNDPSEELRDYFSDWDYYSDDYFDDDPKLSKNTLDGGFKQGQTPRKQVRSAKRDRKRKLSEVRQKPADNKEIDALTACLQGTVWKVRTPEFSSRYEKGTESPVALRLSKDIMRSAYGTRQGFGRGQVKRDESWANDMSLADMGLKAETSLSMHETNNTGDADDEDEEGAGTDDLEDNNNEEEMANMEVIEAAVIAREPDRIGVQAEPAPPEPDGSPPHASDKELPQKKRRIATSGYLKNGSHELPTLDTSLEEDVASTLDMEEAAPPAERGRGRPKKTESVKQQPKSESPTKQSHLAPRFGRKRKLSIDESPGTRSAASRRAKRMAPEREEKAQKLASRTTRATRSTKK